MLSSQSRAAMPPLDVRITDTLELGGAPGPRTNAHVRTSVHRTHEAREDEVLNTRTMYRGLSNSSLSRREHHASARLGGGVKRHNLTFVSGPVHQAPSSFFASRSLLATTLKRHWRTTGHTIAA